MGEPQRNGHRLQFGTNHLGHFSLTGLLLDRLLPASGSRGVTVNSTVHRIQAAIHFDDLQWERSSSRVAAYGQGKLANLMLTHELQRRLAPNGTTIAVAAHPGVSTTELTRNTPAALRVPVRWLTPMLTQKPAMGRPAYRPHDDEPRRPRAQYYGPSSRGKVRGYPRLVASSTASHDQAIQQRL